MMLPRLLACVGGAVLLCIVFSFGGCAGTGGDAAPAARPAPPAQQEGPGESDLRAPGTLDVDITTVAGEDLDARIDLISFADLPLLQLEVQNGKLEAPVPAGDYRAYVHVYHYGVPVLVDVQDIRVAEAETAFLLVNLLEGAAGRLGVRDFDYDGDLAIDRVEVAVGTDPQNAVEVPGKAVLPFDDQVLDEGPGWYPGELYCHSKYGIGAESVSELVHRAERRGLDFLAITDRNTMAACFDPGFQSDKVVLIPAMAWGTDERGQALVYGPRTMPELPRSLPEAQAECIRVQAQGGLFAVAHPCFPSVPWKWGLGYVNAVQVWCREWRQVPPLTLGLLEEEWKVREGGKEDGRLVHSIAAAAATADLAALSANAQAARFWDYETVRGLMACAVAGSSSASKRVPLGAPVTYVRAKEKSLPAILEGLRLGRTFLSSGLDGPKLFMNADVMNDGSADVNIGGMIPLDVDTMFNLTVEGGEGMKLEVLLNGRPILTKVIESQSFGQRFLQHPTHYGVYRARVVGAAKKPGEGFGPLEVHAMTSPIYAEDITQELLWRIPDLDVDKTWIKLKPSTAQEVNLPEHLPPLIQPR